MALTTSQPMLPRRTVLLGLSMAALAGCAQPLLNEEVARSLRVESIRLDMSDFQGVKGRSLSVPVEQVQADLQANLDREIKAATAGGSRPVRVDVKISRISLVSPGQSFLIGGTSTIAGAARVVDARTGEEVLTPTQVVGTGKGYAPGGIIGAIAAGTPEQDYRNTVAGFSRDLRTRLFGGTGNSAA